MHPRITTQKAIKSRRRCILVQLSRPMRTLFDGVASLLLKSCSVDKIASLSYTVWCVASLHVTQDCHITHYSSVLALVLEIRRLSCSHLPRPKMLRTFSGVTRRFLIGRSRSCFESLVSRRPLCGVFCNWAKLLIGNQSRNVGAARKKSDYDSTCKYVLFPKLQRDTTICLLD